MDYQHHYDLLIKKARFENRNFNELYELHHIVPTCMGGSDEDSNIVKLTPEQHYTAHLLLAKVHDTFELWCAVKLMAGNGNSPSPKNNCTPDRCNNKLYGFARRRWNELAPSHLRDAYSRKMGFSDYQHKTSRCWKLCHGLEMSYREVGNHLGISFHHVRVCVRDYAKKNDLLKEFGEITKRIRSDTSSLVRKNYTEEQETRRISNMKSSPKWKRRNDKMKISRIGSGNPMYERRFKHKIVKCPHCGFEGGISSTKRWHFDNCKHKNQKKMKVKKVIFNQRKADVYDIETPSHTYLLKGGLISHNTQEMFAKDVVSGGTGITYSSDSVWIIGRRQDKVGQDIKGYHFVIKIEKSRFVKEGSKIPISVSFDGGIMKYSGLLDVALEGKYVVKPKNGWYRYGHDEDAGNVREKETYNKSFWDPIFASTDFEKYVTDRFTLAHTKMIEDEDIIDSQNTENGV